MKIEMGKIASGMLSMMAEPKIYIDALLFVCASSTVLQSLDFVEHCILDVLAFVTGCFRVSGLRHMGLA
jgi:hypothetical protein